MPRLKTKHAPRTRLEPNQSPSRGYIRIPIVCSAGVAVFDVHVRPDVAAELEQDDWWQTEALPQLQAIADRAWSRMTETQRAECRGAA
jgi:hypothetical protein